MKYMFTASGLTPLEMETAEYAREYANFYASRGHKDCKVWNCIDVYTESVAPVTKPKALAVEYKERWDEQEKDVGRKYDQDKIRYSLLPSDILREVVEVLEFGAKKYGAHKWHLVPDAKQRYWDAALRHIWQSIKEPLDSETGKFHEAHAICCLLFRGQLQIEDAQDFTHTSDLFEPKQNAQGDYE